MRVDVPQEINGNLLISIGTSFLLVLEETENQRFSNAFSDLTNFGSSFQKKNILKLKVFGGESHGQSFQLDPTVKRSVVLGRVDDCDLIVEDSILSKKHCTFSFDTVSHKWTV